MPMKKVNLIISHSDLVNVISSLIDMECFEPMEPDVTLDPPELTDLLHREVMELDAYEANYEHIVFLTTQYTYYLTGWLPTESEPALVSMLSKYMCAWEVLSLSPIEAEEAPAIMKMPNLLGKMRSGGRRVFTPLAKVKDT